ASASGDRHVGIREYVHGQPSEQPADGKGNDHDVVDDADEGNEVRDKVDRRDDVEHDQRRADLEPGRSVGMPQREPKTPRVTAEDTPKYDSTFPHRASPA